MRALRALLNLVLWPAAALLAGLCALAGVAAQFGRFSVHLDVAAHFAPFWLAGAVLTLVFSLMFHGWRRKALAVTSLVGLVAALTLIAPEYLRSTGPHAPRNAPDQLKVVQFNGWHDNPRPGVILAWLAKEQPDIAVIEENPWRFKRAPAQLNDWSVACRHCEVMILSRTPAIATADTWTKQGPRAPFTGAVFRDRRGTFEIIGVHNSWPVERDQPFQERRLAQVLAGLPKDRTILTGDFNSAPWSFQRRRWDKAFGLVRRERAIPSWPAQPPERLPWLTFPILPIDHVYAGKGWATVSVRRGPRLSSDHYPLVLILAPVVRR